MKPQLQLNAQPLAWTCIFIDVCIWINVKISAYNLNILACIYVSNLNHYLKKKKMWLWSVNLQITSFKPIKSIIYKYIKKL